MGRACSTYGGERRCIQGLAGKPEGIIPLGRPRRRWEANIKMDLLDVGCGGMYWIDLAQDRVMWCKLGNEPSCTVKCREFLD